MQREIDKFSNKWEARIRVSDHRYHRREDPYNYMDFNNFYKTNYTTSYNIEQYIEILIPEHRFKYLIHQDRQLDESLSLNEHANRMMQRSLEDERVRAENPAVDKAYRNYLTLLELARK